MIKRGEFYRNLKTDEVYYVVDLAINTTNKNDGNVMVIYASIKNIKTLFVREYNEFKEKFMSYG